MEQCNEEQEKSLHLLNHLFLFYAIYNLCSYFMAMAYVVYLTMLNYVHLLCSFLVLLDYVCIIFSTLMHLSDLVSLMKLP